MPWCPKCRSEYRQGFKVCSDCRSELVEELESIIKNEEYGCGYENDKEAYLTNVSNGIEADFLESILKSENIPVLKKHRETGSYLKITMGDSVFGIDLFVPSKRLEEARNILDSGILKAEYVMPEVEQESVPEEETSAAEKAEADEGEPELEGRESSDWERKISVNRRFIKWYVILMLFGLVCTIVSMFYQIFNSIRR